MLYFFYSWNYKYKYWKKRRNPLEEEPNKAKMFVRVYSVSPNRPELLAMRFIFSDDFVFFYPVYRTLLLYRTGPTSYEDLRTVDGKIYATFMEAAQKLGLIESDEMFVRAMEDACSQFLSQKKLCYYFSMLLCHACPADPEKLFEKFLDQMYPAPIVNNCKGAAQQPLSKEFRRGKILCILEYYLRCQGSSCR